MAPEHIALAMVVARASSSGVKDLGGQETCAAVRAWGQRIASCIISNVETPSPVHLALDHLETHNSCGRLLHPVKACLLFVRASIFTDAQVVLLMPYRRLLIAPPRIGA